tara:strand:- start:20642 stop:21538 length:897 start_codon:yes stop_codon:yes gene_type:complete
VKKKRKKKNNIELSIKKELFMLLIVFISISIFFIVKPKYTGYVIYQPSSYDWTFSNSEDYTFDNNIINLTNSQVTLLATETLNTWYTYNELGYTITKALYNSEDVTNKVQIFNDGENQKVKNNKVFNVTFSDSLNNGDIINFYLKGGGNTDIYLCDPSIFCISPGYGLVHHNQYDEGWYNITINNLQNTSKIFNINVNDEIKFDYINASYTQQIEEKTIEITETKPETNLGITGRTVKFKDLKANPLVITILIIAILLIIAHHFRDRIKKSYPFFKSKEQQHKQHTEDHNTNDQPKTM